MLETRLEPIKREAEDLLFQMNGGKKETLTAEFFDQTEAAAVHVPTRQLFVNPHLVLSEDEAKEHFPNARKAIYTKLNQNTKLRERAKHFILAHEMAHIHHNDPHRTWERPISNLLMIPTALLIIPYLSLAEFIVTLLSIRTLAVTLLKPLRQYSEQYREHEADLTALRTTKDMEAAKYFFESIKPLEKRFSWTHPSSEKRLEHLEKHV